MPPMERAMWFEALTGFAEKSPEQVRANIAVDGAQMVSHVNGNQMICGNLEILSLAELRGRVLSSEHRPGLTKVRELVADVQQLHAEEGNAGSLFQVASQFNLLEMPSPGVTPEQGVGAYDNDRTQGPACAIAAGAGTIYRNYFAPVNGQIGQSETNQIDCLADIGNAMRNSAGRLWAMRNGYALATKTGLLEISDRLQSSSDAERDKLRELLRIGIQKDTQVTLNDSHHRVSQAYCSALPVAYSKHPPALWSDFATLILEASYEATFCAAILNSIRTGNNTVFLTLLGGGAFGNAIEWIIHSMRRAIDLYNDFDMDVAIVSYGSSKPCIQQLITEI
jgi:hypothetical protein